MRKLFLFSLAIKNITTASYCGGINTIIRNVLDSQVFMQHFLSVLPDSG